DQQLRHREPPRPAGPGRLQRRGSGRRRLLPDHRLAVLEPRRHPDPAPLIDDRTTEPHADAPPPPPPVRPPPPPPPPPPRPPPPRCPRGRSPPAARRRRCS